MSVAATGLMDGAGIKPGTVGHRQLGRHSVSGANLVKNSIGITNLNGALRRQVNRRARVTLPSQSGTPGAKGSAGPQGAVGAAGLAGAKGDTGAAGAAGPAGAKGDTGAAGTPGTQGGQGSQGAPGPKGDAGAQGPKGDAGPQGASATGPLAITSFGPTYGPNTFQAAPYGDNSQTVEPCASGGRGSEAAGGTNGTVAFATPPAAPPLGSKALEMTATNGKTVATYFPQDGCKSNQLLSQLTDVAYSSLVVSRNASDSGGNTDLALQIEMTKAATGTLSGYTTMVYEPYLNGQAGATTWTMHNVAAGKVWSTHGLTTGDCSQASPCPYAQFQADNPNAVIGDVKLRIGQNSGAGWSGFDGYADNVWLNFARYDLGG